MRSTAYASESGGFAPIRASLTVPSGALLHTSRCLSGIIIIHSKKQVGVCEVPTSGHNLFSSNCLRNHGADSADWFALQHGDAGQAGVSPVPAVPQPVDLATGGSPVLSSVPGGPQPVPDVAEAVAVAEAVVQPASVEVASAEAVVGSAELAAAQQEMVNNSFD